MGKQIVSIPKETMEAFKSYSWPGNIRELQNMLERAVILANDGALPNPLPPPLQPAAKVTGPVTLRDFERALILQTLEGCSWVVGGPNGAAARLGLKRTTLYQRIKRMGIKPPSTIRHADAQRPDRGSVANGRRMSPDVQHVPLRLHHRRRIRACSHPEETAHGVESAALTISK
jgi:hypothetical protein